MTREEAITIIGNHTWTPRANLERDTDTEGLIYWAIKIRDGIRAAREWRNAEK